MNQDIKFLQSGLTLRKMLAQGLAGFALGLGFLACQEAPVVTPEPQPVVTAAKAPEPVVSAWISHFQARYRTEGLLPERVAHLWFEAIYHYLEPATRPEGAAALELILEQNDWQTAPELMVFRDNLLRRPYIFYSYDRAASPGAGYQIDPTDFELSIVSAEPLAEHRYRLALKSMGTDTPRYVLLSKNFSTGLWQVQEFSTLYNGIVPPPSDPPRFSN